MNKINGIDVSEWELKGVLIPITECKYFEGIGDCKESKVLCVDNYNCYFKQLKRLQEENKKLKEILSQQQELDNEIEALSNEDKYKQALEEIRSYCDEQNLKADYTACYITNRIDEVLNDRD